MRDQSNEHQLGILIDALFPEDILTYHLYWDYAWCELHPHHVSRLFPGEGRLVGFGWHVPRIQLRRLPFRGV